ncbi:hypothetical protein PCE1_004148 [Barthelona sp. PCE]
MVLTRAQRRKLAVQGSLKDIEIMSKIQQISDLDFFKTPPRVRKTGAKRKRRKKVEVDVQNEATPKNASTLISQHPLSKMAHMEVDFGTTPRKHVENIVKSNHTIPLSVIKDAVVQGGNHHGDEVDVVVSLESIMRSAPECLPIADINNDLLPLDEEISGIEVEEEKAQVPFVGEDEITGIETVGEETDEPVFDDHTPHTDEEIKEEEEKIDAFVLRSQETNQKLKDAFSRRKFLRRKLAYTETLPEVSTPTSEPETTPLDSILDEDGCIIVTDEYPDWAQFDELTVQLLKQRETGYESVFTRDRCSRPHIHGV